MWRAVCCCCRSGLLCWGVGGGVSSLGFGRLVLLPVTPFPWSPRTKERAVSGGRPVCPDRVFGGACSAGSLRFSASRRPQVRFGSAGVGGGGPVLIAPLGTSLARGLGVGAGWFWGFLSGWVFGLGCAWVVVGVLAGLGVWAWGRWWGFGPGVWGLGWPFVRPVGGSGRGAVLGRCAVFVFGWLAGVAVLGLCVWPFALAVWLCCAVLCCAVVAWLCWFVVRLCWLSGAGLCALRRLLCGAWAVLFVAAGGAGCCAKVRR